MQVDENEGYDEILQRFLNTLTPEQRCAGLTLEQRLASLTVEQRLLLLPDNVLRGLSADYLETLTEATRAAIGERIERYNNTQDGNVACFGSRETRPHLD